VSGAPAFTLQAVYPKYDKTLYEKYQQDSIVGAWEKLADMPLNSTDAAGIGEVICYT
jgi:hypothetical protein